jgi:ABC-type transporter Mla subunit MlaD
VSSVLRDEKTSIKTLIANGASAVSEVNALLVENRKQIGELVVEAGGVAREARVTLGKVNAGLGDGRPVAQLLTSADGALRAAQQAVTQLTPPAAALLTDAARVTGLVTDQRVDRALAVADKAAAAAGQAGGLIDNVSGLVTDLRAGKGTAGALLARDELYSDLRELIRDLKRNPWKLFWKE